VCPPIYPIHRQRLRPFPSPTRTVSYMNIFTPWAASKVRYPYPVMIYIHGGFFDHGSGNTFAGHMLAASQDGSLSLLSTIVWDFWDIWRPLTTPRPAITASWIRYRPSIGSAREHHSLQRRPRFGSYTLFGPDGRCRPAPDSWLYRPQTRSIAK